MRNRHIFFNKIFEKEKCDNLFINKINQSCSNKTIIPRQHRWSYKFKKNYFPEIQKKKNAIEVSFNIYGVKSISML